MKKRRTLIISLLLIAALALGVGYAVNATHLYIDGTARVTPDQNNLKVVFDSTVNPTSTAPTLATGALNSTNKTEATIDAVGFTTGGQTATVTYTIKNEGVYDAVMDIATTLPIHAGDEAFHVTSELVDHNSTALSTDTSGKYIIKAGQSIQAQVTVTLTETPIDMKEATIKITITANALTTDVPATP